MRIHLPLAGALLVTVGLGATAVLISAAGMVTEPAPEPVAPAVIVRAAPPAPAPLPPTEPLPVAEPMPKPPVEFTLVAVGDIMLSRNVGSTIVKKGDVHWPYAETVGWLRDADITFANLETSVTPGREIKTNEMTFRADPNTVDGLAAAGFDVLSLANNHTPNFGQKGLTDTLSYLTDGEIAFVGAGPNLSAARAPVFVERNGLTVAFLAYTDPGIVPTSYAAAENRAGTAFMNETLLAEEVAAAKAKADFVVVSMHSGTEYIANPIRRQTSFARAAVDAGAAAVIGHHPHVIQTFERYKGAPMFYSLGNFVFDQMWSEDTRQGLAARFTFTAEGVTDVAVRPVRIYDYGQPRPMDLAAAKRPLTRLRAPLEPPVDGWYRIPPPAPLPAPEPSAAAN
jgi:poly-gamma-glutamate synthesis protein (capsule biosynthesis protein)